MLCKQDISDRKYLTGTKACEKREIIWQSAQSHIRNYSAPESLFAGLGCSLTMSAPTNRNISRHKQAVQSPASSSNHWNEVCFKLKDWWMMKPLFKAAVQTQAGRIWRTEIFAAGNFLAQDKNWPKRSNFGFTNLGNLATILLATAITFNVKEETMASWYIGIFLLRIFGQYVNSVNS